MRLPHRLTTPSSLIRRRPHSSLATQRNLLSRGAVARLATGRTHCYFSSTSVGPPPSSRRGCIDSIQVGGFANSYDGAPSLKKTLDRYGDIAWPNKGCRAFSSAGGVDEDHSDETNQEIISHAESGDISKAEESLGLMQAGAISQNNADGLPDIDSYTALMNACIDEQRDIISATEEERDDEVTSDANTTMPNEEHSAQSNERGTVKIMALAEKAHDLLVTMEDLSGVSDHYSSMRPSGSALTELRNPSLRPTSHHYDSVISASANVATAARDANYTSHLIKNAPFVAQRWLQRMETLAFDPKSGVTPTVDSYFHVMKACAASSVTDAPNNKRCKAPALAQSIFDKLKQNTNIRPMAREHRLMLRTWAGSVGHKEAAYRAMGFWMTMQREFGGGVEEMEPTLEDGKMVLEACTRAIQKHTARRAQTILTTMEKLHASKKTNVRPDLDCYRYTLITMSRSRVPTVGSNVPKLLKSMEDNNILPDTACFDAAIETLKNCARHSIMDESEKYAKATESMMLRMELQRERSSESVIRPTAATYTNVIQALAVRKTTKSAERADVILANMEKEYAAGDPSMQPTKVSYVGVIHAYGHSDAEDKYLRADGVLRRMIAQHEGGNEAARPDVFSFHAVIRACSRTAEATSSTEYCKEALLLAISTVQYMKKSESHRPNAKSYLLLLQCCANLLPPGSAEREKALRSIFRTCRKDGLVNRQVLKQFQSTVSTEAYHCEVVQDAPRYDGVKSLPETWTRSLGRKRNPIISVGGDVIGSMAHNDHKMRKRWEKRNQKLLQGGRS
eukprot:CAMPEP_0172537518 /NCGR_PEP_ID=MMETSP1067-20121228/9100_1 /TAXON_ID=265564 ORGANISM="Thalassiosira punctigera, Strain Tpunct2005C2" /NCGR_SAMPLE_ID=MMETSP1067 /ASSEMBLY_ACC=CAM_ASM_000444 /LENGTH=792 /DNA_ID=CAMNT_0013322835 /DNA_START=71 /DNA_END=2449 /DNA_ORIENTATION=-